MTPRLSELYVELNDGGTELARNLTVAAASFTASVCATSLAVQLAQHLWRRRWEGGDSR